MKQFAKKGKKKNNLTVLEQNLTENPIANVLLSFKKFNM